MKRRKSIKPPKINVKGVDKNTVFDYKNTELISKYLTGRGKIASRSRSGLTAKQQRQLTTSIKRARVLSLLPYAK